MLESTLEKIIGEFFAQIFFIILGSVLLYSFQTLKLAIQKYTRRVRLKRALDMTDKKVVDLANGDPDFAKTNIHVTFASTLGKKRCLYIAMSQEHQAALHEKQRKLGYSEEQLTRFSPDTTFFQESSENSGSCFRELQEYTGIENLCELIEQCRQEVGKAFVDAKNGLLFNAKKYGLFDIHFTRTEDQEKPIAELTLFETDYFTHRVFRAVYHKLKANNHEIVRADGSNLKKYRPFLTSFGVNCLLICQGSKGKEIVLSRRSQNVHNVRLHTPTNAALQENEGGGKALPASTAAQKVEDRLHITMNEGLSETDKDMCDKVDLELCFKRGLQEELGIDTKLYNLASRSAFYDFFLEKSNFEVGLTSMIEFDLDFKTAIEPLVARDKTLESSRFECYPLKESVLAPLVKNENFVDHGLYTLHRVLLREQVDIYRSKNSIFSWVARRAR